MKAIGLRPLVQALLFVLFFAPVVVADDGGEKTVPSGSTGGGSSAASQLGGKLRIWPRRPSTRTLPNGLSVVLAPWDSPGVVAYFTVVRAGSRDEIDKGATGFAHLFEHMMFRGTKRFPGAAYDHAMQALGADNNAYTSSDYTAYTTVAPASALGRVIDMEADRFIHLDYDEAVFKTETGAVLGEYNVWASHPEQAMWESLSELAFRRHTYGHTTIGYLRDIRAMSTRFEYSKTFFRRHYTPDNCTIIIAGDFDSTSAMRDIRQHYGSWGGTRIDTAVPSEPEPTKGRDKELVWESATAPKAFIAYRVPAFRALDDTAALQVVHHLLFDASADLYQDLVVRDRSLLSLASSAGDFSRDPGLFVVEAVLSERGTFAEVTRRIQQRIDALVKQPIDGKRLEAVKTYLRYRMPMSMKGPHDVAELLARFIGVGETADAVERYADAIERVSERSVQNVARSYLVPSRRFIVTLAKKDTQRRREKAGPSTETKVSP